MSLFKEIFAWWTGNTWGTRLWTWRKGELVGEDELGNRYYRERGGRRRWVIYNGEAEASKVPPDWHGWLHYTVDEPPTEEAYEPREWQKPPRPNMTGTPEAYRPRGSTLSPDPRPARPGGYRAWRPNEPGASR
jgi:NADH:ubiquinone oxidoreductase subunit